MTYEEAVAVLKQYGYVPGQSRTAGMPQAQRLAIKRACRVLRHEAPADPTPAPKEA